MPTEHKHLCPKCFGHKMCRMDCTIDPDLGLTAQGWPRGAHMNCAECGPDDPRPDDMAELAQAVARELSRVAPWSASGAQGALEAVRVLSLRKLQGEWTAVWTAYSMFDERFDNLGPRAIASVIQAEETKRAQEWAGDK